MKRMKGVRSVLLAAAVGAMACALDRSALADIHYWSGLGSNGNWSTAANWSGSSVPNASAWDAIVFDGTYSSSTPVNSICDLRRSGYSYALWDQIKVTNPGADIAVGGTYQLRLGADIPIDMSTATKDLTISAPAYAGWANQTMNVASGRTLAFSGALAGSDDVTKPLTITGGGKVVLGANDAGDNAGLSLSVHQGTVELNKATNVSPHVHAATWISGIDSGATVKVTGTGDYPVYDAGSIAVTGGILDLNGRNQLRRAGQALTMSMTAGSTLANSNAGASSIIQPYTTTLYGDVNVSAAGNLEWRNTISADGGNAYGITKTGAGIFFLHADCTYTGDTTVNQGKLQVNWNQSIAGNIVVAAGAGVGGISTGTVGATIKGAGRVSPGDTIGGTNTAVDTPGVDPGIFATSSIDPSAGLDLALELTQTGSPKYSDSKESVNDVLRLKDATTPMASALTSSNAVDVYLGVGSLAPGDQFRGGVYVDAANNPTGLTVFYNAVIDASYNYYVLGGGGGGHVFNGVHYYSLAEYNAGLSIAISTVAETAAFAGGSVSGGVMQFTVTSVPEPGVLMLLSTGLLGLLAYAWRKRK